MSHASPANDTVFRRQSRRERPGALLPAALLFAATSWSGPAAGQSPHCDPEILAEADPSEPHQYQDRNQARCEGTFGQEVAREELWLGSLTENLDYELNNRPIHVSWPRGVPDRINLRAVGVRDQLFYRMDRVQEGADGSWAWPSDVLFVRRIPSTSIGVLAWSGSEERPLIVPVRATQRDDPGEWSGRYTMIVFPQVRLDSLFVTIARVDEVGKRPDASSTFIRTREPAGRRFLPRRAIRVPIDDLPAAGIYYVRVEGRGRDASPAMNPFWLFHQPVAGRP